MKIKVITHIILAAVLAVACSDDAPQPTDEGSATLELNVRIPEATAQGQVQTRAVVGLGQPDSYISTFNLCVIPDRTENTSWYHDYLGYDNLLGRCNWSSNSTTGVYALTSNTYSPRGTNISMPALGLFPTKGNVWIYGVYPYIANFHQLITDLDHIEYKVGSTNNTNHDYMYVDPVYVDMTGLKPGDTQTRDLEFRHVMTALEVRLTTTHIGTVSIDSIVLEAYDGSTTAPVFSMSGTFSARNGAVTPHPDNYADRLKLTYGITTVAYKFDEQPYRRYSPFAFLFPAVEHKPGRKFRATIHFRHINQAGLSLAGQSAVMDFEFDNIQTAGAHQGLVAGYRYIYKAEIDNFIKYSGYPEIEEWVVPTGDPDDDQIKDIII